MGHNNGERKAIVARTKDELEAAALKLPPAERARLVHRLLTSLESLEGRDVEADWIEEAERRYADYRKGILAGRPADVVLREAKAHLE
jgi:putative addiction module component (TIGR02574 family)